MLVDDLEVIESGVKLIAEEAFHRPHRPHPHHADHQIPFIEPGLNETAVLGVSIDITEQKHAKGRSGPHAALSQEHHRFDALDLDHRRGPLGLHHRAEPAGRKGERPVVGKPRKAAFFR